MSTRGPKRIWSAAAYDLLYQELVNRFGSLDMWATSSRPGRDLDKKFERFCETFAEMVGANSADAVKHQIAYSVMSVVSSNKSIMMNLILNKAAAYHAGFIKFTDMPQEGENEQALAILDSAIDTLGSLQQKKRSEELGVTLHSLQYNIDQAKEMLQK